MAAPPGRAGLRSPSFGGLCLRVLPYGAALRAPFPAGSSFRSPRGSFHFCRVAPGIRAVRLPGIRAPWLKLLTWQKLAFSRFHPGPSARLDFPTRVFSLDHGRRRPLSRGLGRGARELSSAWWGDAERRFESEVGVPSFSRKCEPIRDRYGWKKPPSARTPACLKIRMSQSHVHTQII